MSIPDEDLLKELKGIYETDKIDQIEQDIKSFCEILDQKLKIDSDDVPDVTRKRNGTGDDNEVPTHDVSTGSKTEEDLNKSTSHLLSSREHDLDELSKIWGEIQSSLEEKEVNPDITNHLSQRSRENNLEDLNKLWSEIQETKQRLDRDVSSLLVTQDKSIKEIVPEQSVREIPTEKQLSSGQSQEGFSPSVPVSRISPGKRAIGSGSSSAENKFASSSPKISTCTNAQLNRPKRKINRAKKNIGVERNKDEALDIHDDVVILSDIEVEGKDIQAILDDTNISDSELDEILSDISGSLGDCKLLESSSNHSSKKSEQPNLSDHLDKEASKRNYMQKYYEEKFRREHCEDQISNVQKELLETKQKVAILENILQSKESSFKKLKKYTQSILAQFKAQKKDSKAQIELLRTDLDREKDSLKLANEEISTTNKKLEDAIKYGGSLKDKLSDTLSELDALKAQAIATKETTESEIEILNAKVEKGKQTIQQYRSTIDEKEKALNGVLSEAEEVKCELKKKIVKAANLEDENLSLKSLVESYSEDKESLLAETTTLHAEAERLKADKIVAEASFRRLIKDEREKLHEYYNAKIRDILQVESQKMIQAEQEFIKHHDKRLEDIQIDSKRRLEEVRESFTKQFNQMKLKLETQIKSLKKENEEKGKVMGAISKQLQSFTQGQGADTENKPLHEFNWELIGMK